MKEEKPILTLDEILSATSIASLKELYGAKDFPPATSHQLLMLLKKDWKLHRKMIPPKRPGIKEPPCIEAHAPHGDYKIYAINHPVYLGKLKIVSPPKVYLDLVAHMVKDDPIVLAEQKFLDFLDLPKGVVDSLDYVVNLKLPHSTVPHFQLGFGSGLTLPFTLFMFLYAVGRLRYSQHSIVHRTDSDHPLSQLTYDQLAYCSLPQAIQIELQEKRSKYLRTYEPTINTSIAGWDSITSRSAFIAHTASLLNHGNYGTKKTIIVGAMHAYEIKRFLEYGVASPDIRLLAENMLENPHREKYYKDLHSKEDRRKLSKFSAGILLGSAIYPAVYAFLSS